MLTINLVRRPAQGEITTVAGQARIVSRLLQQGRTYVILDVKKAGDGGPDWYALKRVKYVNYITEN